MASRPSHLPRLDLWLRLYAHALLRESKIFPNINLDDWPQDYKLLGLADIWRGDYRGEPVCVKVIRTQDRIPLTRIKAVGSSSVFQRHTQHASEQSYHRVGEGGELNPHPNVLPIIKVSETLLPLYVMTPWMPDGNVIQYTQKNPGTDRLTLVHASSPEI